MRQGGQLGIVLVITKELLSKYFAILPVVAIAAAAAAAAGAGCGGASGGADDSYSVVADTTVTTASFPKAQLVPRINRICRRAWPVIIDNFVTYSSLQESKEGAGQSFAEEVRLSLLAGIDFHVFDSIYDLGAPRSEEREIEAIIGSMQSAVERGQKRLAPVSSVAQVSALFGAYNQRARRYGLGDCLVDEAQLRKIEA